MRLRKTTLAAAAGLLVFRSAAILAQADPGSCAGVEKAVREVLARTGVPGASVALVRDGRIACAAAWGDAKLEPKTSASPAMRYSIGSVSKQFTAAAILMLAEEGKLSLDDPVARFLPDLTDAKRREDPPAPVAHVRLPGLLAAGLRAAVHEAGRRPRPRSSTAGRSAPSTSRRARSTSTATPRT